MYLSKIKTVTISVADLQTISEPMYSLRNYGFKQFDCKTCTLKFNSNYIESKIGITSSQLEKKFKILSNTSSIIEFEITVNLNEYLNVYKYFSSQDDSSELIDICADLDKKKFFLHFLKLVFNWIFWITNLKD